MDEKENNRIRKKILKKWAKKLGTHEQDNNLIELLDCFELVDIARPFVILDIKNNVGKKIILDRYGITEGQYRGIGIKAGIFKRSRF